jgi:hypothetical protein
MASFPNLQYCEPSAYAEGFGTFRISPFSAGPLHAAARTACPPSELAMLRGNQAVQFTPKLLTETQRASQPSAFSVGASASSGRGEARG